jgi:uroporphyrinogen-III synthase
LHEAKLAGWLIFSSPTLPSRSVTAKPLAGRTIAIPETRELDLFARMLEQRGANTVRCPLLAILDAPDQARDIA